MSFQGSRPLGVVLQIPVPILIEQEVNIFSFLQVALSDGKLVIEQEGRTSKFRRRVQEKTFAGTSGRGRRVLYVTERAVFRLGENSGGACIELIEIAPGVRLEQDVLAHMEFRPLMRDVQLMDKRCFLP